MAQKKVPVVGDVLLQAAMALGAHQVSPMMFEPLVAKNVCTEALVHLDARGAEVKPYESLFDLVLIRQLPALCDRAASADNEVDKARAVRVGSKPELVASSLAWRQRLLPLADTLAANRKVDANEVARIRRGFGTNDYVRDVADLCVVLKPFAALVNETCGDNAFEEASKTAAATLEALGLSRKDAAATRAAVDLRNRFATLIVMRHDRLRVLMAALTSYAEAKVLVKALGSGRHASKPPETEPTPAPMP